MLNANPVLTQLENPKVISNMWSSTTSLNSIKKCIEHLTTSAFVCKQALLLQFHIVQTHCVMIWWQSLYNPSIAQSLCFRVTSTRQVFPIQVCVCVCVRALFNERNIIHTYLDAVWLVDRMKTNITISQYKHCTVITHIHIYIYWTKQSWSQILFCWEAVSDQSNKCSDWPEHVQHQSFQQKIQQFRQQYQNKTSKNYNYILINSYN